MSRITIERIVKCFLRILRLGTQVHPSSYINVGILYIALGKYDIFFEQFYLSFRKNFLSGSTKKFFVFTDSKRLLTKYKGYSDIVFISVDKRGWPFDTLLRNRYFFQNFEKFTGMDYLFFANANLNCKEKVYLDDFGFTHGYKLAGVLHPYFFHQESDKFPIEKELQCNAYFTDAEIAQLQGYFQGCFYGGNFKQFKELVTTIYEWTEQDLSRNLIPIWHDESYLNRYLANAKVYPLHSGFAYPESVLLPFKKKIVQLDKAKHGGQDFLRK